MSNTFTYVGGPKDGERVMMGNRPLTTDDVLPRFIEMKHDATGRYENDAERGRFVWIPNDPEQ